MIRFGPVFFREVVLVDFQYRCPDGLLPEPICMVARKLRAGLAQPSGPDFALLLRAAGSRKRVPVSARGGGPCRTRTCDFDHVTIALYQLS